MKHERFFKFVDAMTDAHEKLTCAVGVWLRGAVIVTLINLFGSAELISGICIGFAAITITVLVMWIIAYCISKHDD